MITNIRALKVPILSHLQRINTTTVVTQPTYLPPFLLGESWIIWFAVRSRTSAGPILLKVPMLVATSVWIISHICSRGIGV